MSVSQDLCQAAVSTFAGFQPHLPTGFSVLHPGVVYDSAPWRRVYLEQGHYPLLNLGTEGTAQLLSGEGVEQWVGDGGAIGQGQEP